MSVSNAESSLKFVPLKITSGLPQEPETITATSILLNVFPFAVTVPSKIRTPEDAAPVEVNLKSDIVLSIRVVDTEPGLIWIPLLARR